MWTNLSHLIPVKSQLGRDVKAGLHSQHIPGPALPRDIVFGLIRSCKRCPPHQREWIHCFDIPHARGRGIGSRTGRAAQCDQLASRSAILPSVYDLCHPFLSLRFLCDSSYVPCHVCMSTSETMHTWKHLWKESNNFCFRCSTVVINLLVS